MSDLFDAHPYRDRYPVLRGLPEEGRDRAQVLTELREMASSEDQAWESGQCSGTMYCGDKDHYAFLTDAFGLFAHQNALQRDLCPSATRFEGEIIAMALDLMHASAVTDTTPVGMVTSGGTGSILHAMIAYRDHARALRDVRAPNIVKPETAHPAFVKACHLFGIELRTVPVDPVTTLVDPAAMAAQVDDQTIALIASAGNYPYGTIDPIEELAALALEQGVGLHVDGCLGASCFRSRRSLGMPWPPSTSASPASRRSRPTPTSTATAQGDLDAALPDKAIRNASYFYGLDWSGGKPRRAGRLPQCRTPRRDVGLARRQRAVRVSSTRGDDLHRRGPPR